MNQSKDQRGKSQSRQAGSAEQAAIPTFFCQRSEQADLHHPEPALNQVCFHVYGLDTTIGMAAEAGQLQLNAMEPVIVYSLHQAMGLLSTAVPTFIRTCVNDIRSDAERCQSNLAGSSAFATELVTSIGYEAAAKLVMERRPAAT